MQSGNWRVARNTVLELEAGGVHVMQVTQHKT